MFMMQMANAVEFMHGMSPPMIHRDLKPANMLISYEDTDRPVIKVAGRAGVIRWQCAS